MKKDKDNIEKKDNNINMNNMKNQLMEKKIPRTKMKMDDVE